MPATPATSVIKRLVCFVKANGHWVLLAIAALLVLCRMVPACYLTYVSSDNIQIPLFFDDTVSRGHSIRNWVWGGHSDLFPELLLSLLAWLATGGHGLLSLQVTSVILFVVFIGALLSLHRLCGGRNSGVCAGAMLLFFTLLIINFHSTRGFGFKSFFVIPLHTGINAMALICFALFLLAVRDGGAKILWWLAGLSFLSSASDSLFLVVFPAPLVVAVFAAALVHRAWARRAVVPLAWALAACAAGHWAAGPIFPIGVNAGDYTHFDANSAITCWNYFCQSCSPSIGGIQGFLVVSAAIYTGVVAALVVIYCFRPAQRKMEAALLTALVFFAAVIVISTAAAILSGNYYYFSQIRYIRFGLMMPLVILLCWFCHVVPQTPLVQRALVGVFALVSLVHAIWFVPPPGQYYTQAMQILPVLRTVMEEEHIEAGLADYWWANLLTFFSDDTLKVRSIYSDGRLFHWVNNIEWYTGRKNTPPPKFRVLLMKDLDPVAVRRMYGEPSRIVDIPGIKHGEIWVYPDEKSIVYEPLFERLDNDPGHSYRVRAALLPKTTGRNENSADSTTARAGRDAEGALIYGPYIRPPGGHYRVIVTYAWLNPPAPGKLATYDTALWDAGMKSSALIDQAPLPYQDGAVHEFSREITLPPGNRGAIEVHAWYHASGDLRIDALELVYLGP